MPISENNLLLRILRSSAYQWLFIIILSILYIILLAVWTPSIHQVFDNISEVQTKNELPLTQSIMLKKGVPPLIIPAQDPFRATGVWAYAAKDHALPANFKPVLKNIGDLAMAGSKPLQLQPNAVVAVQELFVNAKQSGHNLIVRSAYRSAKIQQQIFDEAAAIRGEADTKNYIALPRHSEHETGLAVDVDSYSEQCVSNADSCALSPADAIWLRQNAPNYGFIIRYPADGYEKTGYHYEPWHLRFVGQGARPLTDSGMTLDEFVSRAR